MNLPHDSWRRTFAVVFTGQAFSLLGSAAVNFALVWWLALETGSTAILAYASIAAILPQGLLGPLGGPFVDRWDRRRTMISADLFIALTSAVLIVLFAFGSASVGVVIAIIALRSLGAAFHTPASQAAVPMYVPADQLMRVAGWNFFLSTGVAMAGPVLGAFLIGIAPMTAVIAVDISGALLAVGSLLLVRIPHPTSQAAETSQGGFIAGFVAEFVEGWRELIRIRGILWLTVILTIVTLLYMPLNALFPLMTLAHFGRGAMSASIVEVAFGAGMLVGSLAIGGMSSRIPATRLIGGGICLVGLMLGVSGLLPSSAFWAFVVFCVVMGLSVPLFGAPLTAMFQMLIDPAKLGRVMSLYTTSALLAAVPGLLLAGPLAEKTGIAPWFAISGAAVLLTGVLPWIVPAVRRLDGAMLAAKPSELDQRIGGHDIAFEETSSL
ncbi:MAG: MFS transporter [Thermoleophilia bacterium]|nr:MFS transporter [Thermoleophilia bacterium]